jgi:hypothetical protein
MEKVEVGMFFKESDREYNRVLKIQKSNVFCEYYDVLTKKVYETHYCLYDLLDKNPENIYTHINDEEIEYAKSLFK